MPLHFRPRGASPRSARIDLQPVDVCIGVLEVGRQHILERHRRGGMNHLRQRLGKLALRIEQVFHLVQEQFPQVLY